MRALVKKIIFIFFFFPCMNRCRHRRPRFPFPVSVLLSVATTTIALAASHQVSCSSSSLTMWSCHCSLCSADLAFDICTGHPSSSVGRPHREEVRPSAILCLATLVSLVPVVGGCCYC